MYDNSSVINLENLKISLGFENNDNVQNTHIETNLFDSLDPLNKFEEKILTTKGNEKQAKSSVPVYGSPAIWLKNLKKNSDPHKGTLSAFHTSRNSKLYANQHNKTNNDTIMSIKTKKSSPVMLKFKSNNDNESKIYLYAKHPSFHRNEKVETNNFINANDNSAIGTDYLISNEFKTLICRSRSNVKNAEKKFSNINQGSKISIDKASYEIDEIIVKYSLITIIRTLLLIWISV